MLVDSPREGEESQGTNDNLTPHDFCYSDLMSLQLLPTIEETVVLCWILYEIHMLAPICGGQWHYF